MVRVMALFGTVTIAAEAVHLHQPPTTTTSTIVPQSGASACWIRGSADRIAGRPSPLDSTVIDVGGATVKVCYGRPSARGRQIMGGLVPFDEPWRFGANEATAIHVPFPAEIAGVQVRPGTYTLYVIPGESSWRIAVNGSAQRWGVPINEKVRAQDVGTGTVNVEKLNEHVETLTLKFTQPTGNATELVVEWEKTRVRIPVRRAA
jgi:hypothetical protein